MLFLIVFCLGVSLLGLHAKQADDADKLDGKDWEDIQTIVDEADLTAPNADKLDDKHWEDIQTFIEEQIAQFTSNSVNVGDYKISASTEDHAGWFLCDGRKLFSRDYPEIFNAIGCSFSKDSSNCVASSSEGTFFNLPDPRGRVAGFSGQGQEDLYGEETELSTRTLGDAVGQEAHTLTVDELVSHDHGNHGHGTYTHEAHQHGPHTHAQHSYTHDHSHTDHGFVTSTPVTTSDGAFYAVANTLRATFQNDTNYAAFADEKLFNLDLEFYTLSSLGILMEKDDKETSDDTETFQLAEPTLRTASLLQPTPLKIARFQQPAMATRITTYNPHSLLVIYSSTSARTLTTLPKRQLITKKRPQKSKHLSPRTTEILINKTPSP